MSELRREPQKLFLLGFLTLFLELVLIRYLAGSIWNLGYFPNLVLIGVFVGMGLGFVTHHHVGERTSGRLFHAAALLVATLVVAVAVLRPAVPGFSGSQTDVGGELFFTGTPRSGSLGAPALFYGVFVMIVAVFGLVAQRTAKLFRLFAPLRAYALDIAGSCCGILVFMGMSWRNAPAWIWFVVVAVSFVAASERALSKAAGVSLAALLGVAALAAHEDTRLMARPELRDVLTRWSPYQRVEYVDRPGLPRHIFVNGIPHQEMEPAAGLLSAAAGIPYAVPYQRRGETPALPAYRNVLVLGAGSGNDVATALLLGASHVDAVEIDPVIADLGRRFHPEHPYDDPRVRLVIGDGRAFLQRAQGKYDLILFALTDSLVKVSPMAQLRLENYLFTEECVRRAHELLSEDGDLLFYNFYRQPWIRAKIETMIHDVTGHYPRELYSRSDFAMMAAGRHNRADAPTTAVRGGIDPSVDDWPFLYLRRHRIPRIYLQVMAGLTLCLGALGFWLARSARRFEHLRQAGGGWAKLAFAFMGVAFLLLETKSVIQFSLLFGTTWLNNSLVFLGVLVLVLAGNAVAARLSAAALWPVFGVLGVSCLATLVLPLGCLLEIADPVARFGAASLLTFAPIFFANVLFSVAFRDQDVPEHVFGWNLIGATFGAVLEYASLLVGYNALAWIVLVCYAIAFGSLLAWRSARTRVRRVAA
jgi:SAM-dependent methyltransferase